MNSTLLPINVQIPQFVGSPTTRKDRFNLKQRKEKSLEALFQNSFPLSVSQKETEVLSCAYSIGMAVR